MNNKFKEDLKRGQDFEAVVLEALKKDGMKVIKNPDERSIDILEIIGGIEVKADHYNFHKKIENGNGYIEFECNGKASGVFKDEEFPLRFWVHSLAPNEFFLMDGEKFREWVRGKIEDCEKNKSLSSKGFRVTSGGDGNRTKGLLVPAKELEKQAMRIYNI